MGSRIKSRCERMLHRAEPDIPVLVKQESWEALSGVVKGACRNALQLAMIEARCNNNIKQAKHYFKKGRDFSAALIKIPEGVVSASSLDIPIYCCLLDGDFERAKQLAKIVLSGQIKIVPGSHFDVHSEILASFVLCDREVFEGKISDFNRLEPSYWWGKQEIYFKLYRSVLMGDEASFNNLLHEAIELFKERCIDKEFGDQLGEYGGLDYNQFAIDFMSLGIAAVAKENGLKPYLDNEFFPSELIQ